MMRNDIESSENTLAKHDSSPSLDRQNYLLSLLGWGVGNGLLTPDTADGIKLRVFSLLPKVVEEYTKGMSSSVPEGAAQSLLQSVMYTLDFALSREGSPEQALDLLTQKPLEQIFAKGREQINRQVRVARGLLTRVRQSRVETGNFAYNNTLDEGLELFFKYYDLRFAAHDSPGSIDYPILIDDTSLTGVSYMLQYLKKLDCENRFCLAFSSEDIRTLCRCYDKSFDDLLINLFELVLCNALGCRLLGRPEGELLLSQAEFEKLQVELTRRDCAELLRRAGEELIQHANPTSRFASGYLSAAVELVTGRILAAIQAGRALPFVVYTPEPESPSFTFEDGPKMSDEAFRLFTEELRSCRNTSDKLAIIRSEFHSVEDLADMLGADCLTEEEYVAVFAALGPAELALLLKRIPQYESTLLTGLHDTQGEDEWQSRLTDYLRTLGTEKESLLRRVADQIKM